MLNLYQAENERYLIFMKRILFVTLLHQATETLIERVMAEAEKTGTDISIYITTHKAIGETTIENQDQDYDLILLSPLLRFLQSNPERAGLSNNIPIKTIDSKIYGALDGSALLALIEN
jgi:cellobiose-specific phosphotransferase system component IIB